MAGDARVRSMHPKNANAFCSPHASQVSESSWIYHILLTVTPVATLISTSHVVKLSIIRPLRNSLGYTSGISINEVIRITLKHQDSVHI